MAWYETDREGSIRLLTNGSGSVIDTLTYNGFGAVTSESSPSSGDRYKYASGQADGITGFVLYGHRYLDPLTLRLDERGSHRVCRGRYELVSGCRQRADGWD